MREILFHGKRTDNGEWAEGYFYEDVNGEPFILSIPRDFGFADAHEIDPATVGQYAGIPDKNGKPVFEGDFVRLDDSVKRTFDVDDGVVLFERGSFFIGECHILRSLDTIADIHGVLRGEVIGNIHDNPELLEGDKDEKR